MLEFPSFTIKDLQTLWQVKIDAEFKAPGGGNPFVIRDGMLKGYSNGSWRQCPGDFARVLALMEDHIEEIVNIEALDRAEATPAPRMRDDDE